MAAGQRNVTTIHRGVAFLFEAYQLELSAPSDRKPNYTGLYEKEFIGL